MDPGFNGQVVSLKPLSIGAVYCVYDDERWLKLSIESIYANCDIIYFLVNEKPWYGVESDNQTTLNCILNFPDIAKKINLIRGNWSTETEQRNVGLALLKQEKIDYCLVVDADEIYEPIQLKNMFDFARSHPEIDCWHMQWFTYWKSMNYIIHPKEPFEPVFLTKVQSTSFVNNRLVTAPKHELIPPAIGICHHMSYARSNQEIQKKISTFSHANEILPDWYQQIWLQWDLNQNMQALHPTQPQWYKQAISQPFSALPSVLKRVFVSELEQNDNSPGPDLKRQHIQHHLAGNYQQAQRTLNQLIEAQYAKRLQQFQRQHLYFEIYSQLMPPEWQKDSFQWFRLSLILQELGLYYSAEKHVSKALTMQAQSMETQSMYAQMRENLKSIVKPLQWSEPTQVPYKPCVSVIILTYNQLNFTRECLENLLQFTPAMKELIIIDNASRGGTIEYLDQWRQAIELPVRIIQNEENVGFSRGVNQGLALCQSDWIVLLNNDVIVTPFWLEKLLKHASESRIVSPVYGNFTLDQTPRILFPFFRDSSLPILLEYASQVYQQFNHQIKETHRLSGTCLLFHQQVLDRIGGFDPRFKIGYFEDDDWSYRAKLAGFSLLEVLDTFVYHFGGATMTHFENISQLRLENWQRFCLKWDLSLEDYPEPIFKPLEEILNRTNVQTLHIPLSEGTTGV